MQHWRDFIGVGCRGIIKNDKNEILLLQKHWAKHRERPWWKIEVWEIIAEWLKREIKEETNINIEILNFVSFEEVITDEDWHWIAFCYEAKVVDWELKIMEPKKHKTIKWFPIDNLPENISKRTKYALERYFKMN